MNNSQVEQIRQAETKMRLHYLVQENFSACPFVCVCSIEGIYYTCPLYGEFPCNKQAATQIILDLYGEEGVFEALL